MFGHIFFNRFKCLFRDRELVFWTFLYPIVLGTFFFLAFSNLAKGNVFHKIPIAVVDNAEYQQNVGFQQAIASVSDSEDGDSLFEVSLVDRSQAEASLKSNAIKGYLLLENGTQVVIKESGYAQTILKEFADSYLEIGSAYATVVQKNPQAAQFQSVHSETYLQEANPSKNPNSLLIFYYALIAMAALFGGMWGIKEITDSQADLSAQGARLNLCPIHKLKAMGYSLCASIMMQFLSQALLVAYLTLVLKVDFGNQLLYVLLACFAGSVLGVSFGAMLGAVVRKDENVKTAVLISTSLLMSFLAGLMNPSIKYTMTTAVPALKYINPANLITDAFYSLYYYSTHSTFFLNIGLLLAISVLFYLVVFFMTRRQKYASL